ncbi:MAG TPA: MgtC/SapB family protein [Stellaceae bacterium]|nr:MgtC/SapB family protein [Stellaceae bacterium]
MDPLEVAIRLGTALLIGAVIGFECQWRQRMAGLRTNALVAVGAAGSAVFSVAAGLRVATPIASGLGHFAGPGRAPVRLRR